MLNNKNLLLTVSKKAHLQEYSSESPLLFNPLKNFLLIREKSFVLSSFLFILKVR